MRTTRIAALSFAFALASCGGGGGGAGSPVNPPSAGTTAITVSFVGGTLPTAVAESIGGGWSSAALQGTSLVVNLPTGATTYAIAFRCPTYAVFGFVDPEYVIEATVADGTAYNLTCYTAPTTSSANGSADASALAGAASVLVLGKDGYGASLSAASGAFSGSMLPGTNDVAAIAKDAAKNVLGVKIVRSQTSPGASNGGAAITLAASDAVSTAPVSITNISAGYDPTPECSVSYTTANGTSFYLNNNSTTSYAVVPSSEAAAGDYYTFESNNANLTTHELLGTSIYATNPGGAFTIPLPSPWTYGGPSAAAFPTFTFQYAGFNGMPSIVDNAQISWQENPTTQADINVFATSGYLGGATTLAIPNLTALAGFVAAAPSGTRVYWGAQIDGATYPVYYASNPNPGNGKTAFVQLSGSYTEP